MFKDMFNKNLNKQKNYQKIMHKIERKNMKNYKYIAIPLCLLLVGFISFSMNNKTMKPIINEPNKKIYINEILQESMLDADLEKIDGKILENNNWNFPFINDLNNIIKSDNVKYYEIYVKENTTEYTLLHDYVIEYDNINIAFSKIGKPLRDYYIGDNIVKSIINNKEVIISHKNGMYIVNFNYNDINFDIETNELSLEKLIEIIETIIK